MSKKENTINYIINDTQAGEIAYCIFSDIADYIEKNEAKYQEWLLNQKFKED